MLRKSYIELLAKFRTNELAFLDELTQSLSHESDILFLQSLRGAVRDGNDVRELVEAKILGQRNAQQKRHLVEALQSYLPYCAAKNAIMKELPFDILSKLNEYIEHVASIHGEVLPRLRVFVEHKMRTVNSFTTNNSNPQELGRHFFDSLSLASLQTNYDLESEIEALNKEIRQHNQQVETLDRVLSPLVHLEYELFQDPLNDLGSVGVQIQRTHRFIAKLQSASEQLQNVLGQCQTLPVQTAHLQERATKIDHQITALKQENRERITGFIHISSDTFFRAESEKIKNITSSFARNKPLQPITLQSALTLNSSLVNELVKEANDFIQKLNTQHAHAQTIEHQMLHFMEDRAKAIEVVIQRLKNLNPAQIETLTESVNALLPKSFKTDALPCIPDIKISREAQLALEQGGVIQNFLARATSWLEKYEEKKREIEIDQRVGSLFTRLQEMDNYQGRIPDCFYSKFVREVKRHLDENRVTEMNEAIISIYRATAKRYQTLITIQEACVNYRENHLRKKANYGNAASEAARVDLNAEKVTLAHKIHVNTRILDSIAASKNSEATLVSISCILQEQNTKRILEANRDGAGILLLNGLLHATGIMFLVTYLRKGDARFWRPHSEILRSEIKSAVSACDKSMRRQ